MDPLTRLRLTLLSGAVAVLLLLGAFARAQVVTVGGGGVTFPLAASSDGTALLPAYSFVSEPTLGFWRISAGAVRLQGALSTTATMTSLGNVAAVNVVSSGTGFFLGNGVRAIIADGGADGEILLENNAATIGSRVKVDALPTVASGFGTVPGVTAGSTPLAGSVNVGTGGVATSGVINFNGTAFPSAPFCQLTPTLTNAVQRVSAISTTQLTITTGTAWTASDVVTWVCVSSK
jgi:hypothetical protein